MGTLGDIKDIGILALLGVGAYLFYKFTRGGETAQTIESWDLEEKSLIEIIQKGVAPGALVINPPGYTGNAILWPGVYENLAWDPNG